MSDPNLSNFNPELFLDMEADVPTLDTKRPNVPDGDYPGVIAEVKKPEPITIDGQAQFKITVIVKLDVSSVKEIVGVDSVMRRYDGWLDLKAEGGLDFGSGKNIFLGKLREATGQNRPGPWRAGMLVGQPALFKVKNKADKNDQSKIYDNIVDVASLGG